MKELVVISGKGGTGKTSLTASFAALSGKAVIADCDVDAADLHLVLPPSVIERHDFFSGHKAEIRRPDCTGCGECLSSCRFGAVELKQENGREAVYSVDPVLCEGCGVCVRFCPAEAIDFPECLCGEWMVSETRAGPMVHAKLIAAAENSGKLVTTVRREAKRVAEQNGRDLIIVDGPPGIGCPVIASMTGADMVLIVTEPSVSGEHDMERVLSLAAHFSIPAAVCVNKWDINPGMAERIEKLAVEKGARIAGRIRYDRGVTRAQMKGLSLVETGAASTEDVNGVWKSMLAGLYI